MLLEPRPQQLARGAALPLPLPALILLASLALATLTLLLPSAPTYDPWAWIIWGREITELDLDTVGGPSWKPLPVLVTTLSAPLGEVSPYVWLVVARAGGIAGVALAFLLALRLAGPVAGTVAALGLGLMPWWIRNAALGNSEGVMVALVLAGILSHLHGRRGAAFAFALGAALLRPEAWPFLGLYALFLLYEERARIWWVAGGLLTLPVLWLGPELWGSGNAFRASDRAQDPNPNSPAFADNPALEVLKDGIGLAPAAAVAGTVLALVVCAARRAPSRAGRDTVLVLAGLAAAWLGLVAAMTSRGFSGNSRYLIVPGALLIVLGAVGLVWAARAAAPRLRRLPVAAAALLAALLATAFAAPDADLLGSTFRGVEYQADLYHDLGTLVEEGGGRDRLVACGSAATGAFLVPQVAWRLGLHGREVGMRPRPPAVVFHVRTVERSGIAPPLSARRPNLLANAGHWALTADCEKTP